jgi:hypothetical protein
MDYYYLSIILIKYKKNRLLKILRKLFNITKIMLMLILIEVVVMIRKYFIFYLYLLFFFKKKKKKHWRT